MKVILTSLLLIFISLSISWGNFTVESSGPGKVVLLWSGNVSAPPMVRAPLALPPNTQAQLKFEVLSSSPVFSAPQPHQSNQPYSQAKKLPHLSKGFFPVINSAGRFRDVEVAVLEFPSQYLSGGHTQKVNQVRVEVQFVSAPIKSNHKHRSSFAGSRQSPSEKFLAQWLVNYPQSRNFRSVLVAPQKNSSLPAVKPNRLVIKTTSENIVRIEGEALKNAGVPLEDINPRYMRLYKGDKEIPLHIEGDTDGKVDAGDYLEFIGARPEGSRIAGNKRSHNSFYTFEAVFYLTWEGQVPGLRVPLVPVSGQVGGVLGEPEGLAPIRKSFEVNIHLEEDKQIRRIGGVNQGDVLDLGSSVEAIEMTDFWFWQNQGSASDIVNIPFYLPYTPLPLSGNSASDSLRVGINLQGITDVLSAEYDHHIKFLLNSQDISLVDGVENNAKWSGDNSFLWNSKLLSSSVLKPGENILTLQKIGDLVTNTGEQVKIQDAYLDFITLNFRANFKVVGNNIRFHNDYQQPNSTQRYLLEGLAGDEFSLWDMSGRKLTGFSLVPGSSGKQLSFVDSTLHATEYLLAGVESLKPPKLVLDTLDNLLSSDNQADYIVITQKKLLGEPLDKLLAQRESQGLKTRTVFADHIYQIFGDGSTNPESIRSFLKYAYHQWRRPAPLYVLILGETSIWFDKFTGAFQQNIVPTNLIQIPGWGVTSNDDYFTKVSGDDQISDLFIGRIPVANQSDLNNIVTKMLAYENGRENGNWQNRIFLISGFERSFANINNNLQSRITNAGRQFTRLDVWDSSAYYIPAGNEPSFFAQYDSAFNIVSFTGHGGGSVWSDRGLLTLEALDKDSIAGEYSVPLITSMTCLTGFFEDDAQRSLGEELLRRETSGALTFYGASGYISGTAGEKISEQIFEAALPAGEHTVGEIITRAENMVALTTGSRYIPILGEFDLLGDPAMPLSFPAVDEKLTASGSPNEKDPDLSIEAKGLAVESGTAVTSVYAQYQRSEGADSLFFNRVSDVSNAAFGESFEFTQTFEEFPLLTSGRVISHYWDENQSKVTRAEFNSLDWMIDSLTLSHTKPLLGSEVSVGFKISKLPGDIKEVAGRITYEVAQKTDPLQNPEVSQGGAVTPVLESGNIIRSGSTFILKTNLTQLVEPELRLMIDLNLVMNNDGEDVALPGLRSRVYRIPIAAPVDLQFTSPAIRIPIQDKLGVYARFKNAGLGEDSGFNIAFTSLEPDGSVFKTDTVEYKESLKPGQVDSLFLPLDNNSQLNKTLRLTLIASDSNKEVNLLGNQVDTSLQVFTRVLKTNKDSLWSGDGQWRVGYIEGEATRVFMEKREGPLPLPDHLSSQQKRQGSSSFYNIQAPADFTGSLVIGVKNSDSIPAKKIKRGIRTARKTYAQRSATAKLHYYLSDVTNWLRVDTLQGLSDHALWFQSGVYGMFVNSDRQSPDVHFMARGQRLLPDDFIPQRSPLQINIRDDVGIDYYLHPPEIFSREQDFDSTNLVNKPTGNLGKTGVVEFTPKGSHDKDSLSLVVHDLSGNVIQKQFSFKKGTELSVKLYGTYPNPFADSTVIVYQLTDWADEVKLKIYSRAGRLVRSFEDGPGTGYRETVWDGKSKTGKEVANGLYYLKVYAKQGEKNSQATFKIFKMKRK